MKKIILCADDFGQSISISEAIILLAHQRRINATSCMVNMPAWADTYTTLFSVKKFCGVGLHLNFTHGPALSKQWRECYGEQFFSLSKLISLAYTRKLSVTAVTSEIHAQIERFMRDMGVYPDFIDGHQHVHQLPIIRTALLENITLNRTKILNPNFFIRKTYNNAADWYALANAPKIQLLALLGGMHSANMLLKNNIPTNTSFSGIYNFNQAADYKTHFKRFIQKITNNGLIMCHPGKPSQDLTDPISQSRQHEFHYLMSEQFFFGFS